MERKYKKIEVVLKGVGEGLLQHSASAMLDEPKAKSNPTKHYDKVEEAEKVCYRNAEGFLYVPSRCLKACILNGASWYKVGKKSAKPIIAGGMLIEPVELLLLDAKGKKIKDYEIDSRSVVVQRSRIVRHRPIIKEWTLKFDIVYNETILPDISLVEEILGEAGMRIGLLDNRPQKYGDNGMFDVVSFKEKK